MSRGNNTVAILAYLTLIGWIVALILNSNKSGVEKEFNAFHLRQMLGILITIVILNILVSLLGNILHTFYLGTACNIFTLILLIAGILNAAKGIRKPVPVIGEFTEKSFGKIFE